MLQADWQKALRTAVGDLTLHVRLEVPAGTCAALFGPSGVGKTTVLRALAGLVRPDLGQIAWQNQVWYDESAGTFVPPQRRAMALHFQDYALFPHLSARDNVRFALSKGQSAIEADELLALMALTPLADRKPHQLSGGQQQRVALARTLVRRPPLLLLDEPFSALDATLRQRLQHDLQAFLRQHGLTTLLVSHDVAEIYRLADTVYGFDAGRLVPLGTPQAAFGQTDHPAPLRAEVLAVLPGTPHGQLHLRVGTQVVVWEMPTSQAPALQPGDQVVLTPQGLRRADRADQ